MVYLLLLTLSVPLSFYPLFPLFPLIGIILAISIKQPNHHLPSGISLAPSHQPNGCHPKVAPGRFQGSPTGEPIMSNATDLALAFLQRKQALLSSPEPSPAVSPEKPKKVKASPSPEPSKAVRQAEPVSHQPNGLVLPSMPEPGTLDAKTFIAAMRKASSQHDKIHAISGFVGWDPRDSYGNQELRAFSIAKRQLNPINPTGESLEEKRNRQRESLGFVPGLPCNRTKMVQDLLARERIAAETAESLRKEAQSSFLSQEERTLKVGLALVEEERIQAIRSSLRNRL